MKQLLGTRLGQNTYEELTHPKGLELRGEWKQSWNLVHASTRFGFLRREMMPLSARNEVASRRRRHHLSCVGNLWVTTHFSIQARCQWQRFLKPLTASYIYTPRIRNLMVRSSSLVSEYGWK